MTRLSRSKHTLIVNILTIDFTITKIVLLMETKPNQYGIVRILTRVCLDLLSLVNSLHTLVNILTLRFWQYCQR